MNNPYRISNIPGIVQEKYGVCWWKQLSDWWSMDDHWYWTLYKPHYPVNEQLNFEEFKLATSYKCRDEFYSAGEEFISDNALVTRRVTIKDACRAILDRSVIE